MWTCVKWEWFKQVRQVRFWGSLAALTFLGGLFTYGYVHMRNEPALTVIVGRAASDGFFVPVLAASVSSTVLLPFVVAVVSGDAISGDRYLGTWPVLLSQGVRPWQLYAAKWIVGLAYAGLATVTLLASSAIGGILVMGWHATALPSGTVASAGDQVRLLFIMAGYCSAGQMVVASLAVAASAFCRNTLSSVLVVMGSILVMVMVGDFPFLSNIQRLMFTAYFSRSDEILSTPINWMAMEHGLLAFATYALLSWVIVAWFEPFRD